MSDPAFPHDLRDPVAVAAFKGWNDASDAASEVVSHLRESLTGEPIWSLEPDPYYDFQVNRPMVSRSEDGDSELTWPTITIHRVAIERRDLLLISGPEPNLAWRRFCDEIVAVLAQARVGLVVQLGAMLTDSPHSRPVPVSTSANSRRLAHERGFEISRYEGPSGITGVLAAACASASIDAISLWACVPHYVANPPNPKASLALLSRLEEVLDVSLPQGELPELAQAWERGVDELAADDPDVAEYISNLEAQQDETNLPEASGDAIAAEFQRYLRRRDG